MLEAGIKTLEEVKKDVLKDSHVDLTTNTNTVTDAKEMMNKLLEGGTAFKDKTRVATVFAPAAAAGARYRVAAPVAAFAPLAGHGLMPLARQVAPPTVLRQVSPPAKRRKIAGPLRLL